MTLFRSNRFAAFFLSCGVVGLNAQAALAQELTIGDCEEGDAPAAYIATCDDVCIDDAADHDLHCRLPTVTTPTDIGKMWAVTNYTSDHTFSVWGQDESGTAFCCVVDNNGLNPDNVDLFGGTGDDELYFTHDASGTFLDAYSTLDGVKGGIHAGDGDDTLVGSESETNYVDTLSGEQGADTLDGRAGDDVLFADGRVSSTIADTSVNTLNGGTGSDKLYGADGDDLLNGGDGDDFLCGEAGDDTLSGGEGTDTLYGDHWDGTCDSTTDGDDTLDGGTEDDTLQGCYGVDILNGGSGQDTLKGNGDGDWLYGDDGDDIIRGGSGDDMIYGGVGNDTITAGDDNDTVYGQEGHDKVQGSDGVDYLNGGPGHDTLCDDDDGDRLIGEGGDDKLWFDGPGSPGGSFAGRHVFTPDQCTDLGYWWAGLGAGGHMVCSYTLTAEPAACP